MAAPPIAAEPRSKPSPRETSTIVGGGCVHGAERRSGGAAGLRDMMPAAQMSASVTINAPATVEVRACIAMTLRDGGH
jgi:hypothetical protein